MVVPLWWVSAQARCLAPALAARAGEALWHGTEPVADADGGLADRNHAAAFHTLIKVAQRAEDMDLMRWGQGGTKGAAVDWTADPLPQIRGEDRSLCREGSKNFNLCVHARQTTRKQVVDRSLTGHRPEGSVVRHTL